jgi:hypothetical protein
VGAGKARKESQWGLSRTKGLYGWSVRAQGEPMSCPQLGSIRVIHGWKLGAVGVAPSAAVAVDNPSGLSPGVGSGARSEVRRQVC